MCTAEWNSTVSPVVTVVLHILFPPTEATTIITKTHMYLSHYLPSAAGYDSHANQVHSTPHVSTNTNGDGTASSCATALGKIVQFYVEV